MGPMQRVLAAAATLAVVWSGIAPADHLHRTTSLRPIVVHAHWEATGTASGDHAFSPDDEHDTALSLNRAMASGPVAPGLGQTAVPPQPIWMDAVIAADAPRPDANAAPAPSPPPRPAAPRAPPAR